MHIKAHEEANDIKYNDQTMGENNNDVNQQIDSNILEIVFSENTDNAAAGLPAPINIQNTVMSSNGESGNDESVDENDPACGTSEGKP